MNSRDAYVALSKAVEDETLWNTPRCAQTSFYAEADETLAARGRDGLDTLSRQALRVSDQAWSTPGARLGDPRGAQAKRWDSPERNGGRNLDDQVAALWPTPAAANHRSTAMGPAMAERNNSRPLNEFVGVNWTTPTAGDCTGTTGGGMIRSLRRDCHSFHPDPETPPPGPPSSPTTLRLNPRFVAWLMGLPPAWTNFAPLEIPSFLLWRQRHSAHLCAICMRDMDE